MKRICAVLLALLLCAGCAASFGEETEGPVQFCYDFSFRFYPEPHETPFAEREHIRGYEELLGSLEIRGQAAWNTKLDSLDVRLELVPLADPSQTVPIRVFGRPSDVCVESPLLGKEPYFLGSTRMIQAFSTSFWLVTGLPMPAWGLLNPNLALFSVSREREAWREVIPPAEDGARITPAQLETVRDAWADLLETDDAFTDWTNGFRALATDSTLLDEALAELPEVMVNAAGGEDLAIAEEDGVLRCRNAKGEILFEKQETDSLYAFELKKAAYGTFYLPSFLYREETKDGKKSLALRAAWEKTGAGAKDADEEWLMASRPDALLSFRLEAEGIPESLPADGELTARLETGGYLLPESRLALRITFAADGKTEAVVSEVGADGTETPVMRCEGTVVPSEYPEYMLFQYDELSAYPHLLVASHNSVNEMLNLIMPTLMERLPDLLLALPVRACQSIMDDLEGYGLLETLMTGIGADPEEELPPGVTFGTDSD